MDKIQKATLLGELKMAQWRGSQYKRTKKKNAGTWRDGNTGIVYNSGGTPIGIEPRNAHHSGNDPNKKLLEKYKKQKKKIPKFNRGPSKKNKKGRKK